MKFEKSEDSIIFIYAAITVYEVWIKLAAYILCNKPHILLALYGFLGNL